MKTVLQILLQLLAIFLGMIFGFLMILIHPVACLVAMVLFIVVIFVMETQ